MPRRTAGATLRATLATVLLALVSSGTAEESRLWKRLAPIPDAEGFAGSFAGVSGDVLIFAGGANIVGEKWGETFTKKWYDSVFALDHPAGEWKPVGKLPAPLGYGVSVTARDALICIGGSNESGHSDDVFELRMRDGKLATERNLPKLPRPIANACGTLVGQTIYVAGGIETPDAATALHTFLALDLSAEKPAWRELPPWPGPERMLAVAGAHGDSFFLFTGVSLSRAADGKPARTYLRDAYRFTAAAGWKRLADLPRPAVAAPSPAILQQREPLFPGVPFFGVLGGDDGAQVDFRPVEKHPGFPREILAYDVRSDVWLPARDAPFSHVTVPVVQWNGLIVIPNGEVRPRVRTNEVWALKLP